MTQYIPPTDFGSLVSPAPTRFWSANAQTHAGGDNLLWYLYQGWEVEETVTAHPHWLGNNRHVMIFTFTLHKGDQTLVMPTIGNPFVRGFLNDPDAGLTIVEKDAVRTFETAPTQD